MPRLSSVHRNGNRSTSWWCSYVVPVGSILARLESAWLQTRSWPRAQWFPALRSVFPHRSRPKAGRPGQSAWVPSEPGPGLLGDPMPTARTAERGCGGETVAPKAPVVPRPAQRQGESIYYKSHFPHPRGGPESPGSRSARTRATPRRREHGVSSPKNVTTGGKRHRSSRPPEGTLTCFHNRRQ